MAVSTSTTGVSPLPFPFALFGTPVTHASVQSNGMMQVYPSATGTPSNAWSPQFNNSSAPNGFLAPFWRDLFPASDGRIKAFTQGMPGRRVLVVDWTGFESNATAVRFQLKVFEGSSAVEFHYCLTNGVTAGVGLESLGGGAITVPTTPGTGAGVRFVPSE